MSLKLLRQQLRKKEQKELIDEIADLYKKFDSVKSYYQASVFDDDQGVLDKYKQIIEYQATCPRDNMLEGLMPGCAI